MATSLLSDHMARPRNNVRLAGATGRRIHTDTVLGDALRIEVRIEHDRIVEAQFASFGDPVLAAIASYVMEWIRGREIAAIPLLTGERIAESLELPYDNVRYAHVVLLTLLEAVQDHQRQRPGQGVLS